ncbi:alpha-L-rhamnosidase A [Aspergillus steynii IBT 23096]|uniref:alpha-L-rhamnosidase n=1 Tax=Aspergillus steynii IBT 23096 TaxID=1392250 RepID=A0A2I2GGV4_9EURO|nr:alpha-L-rhamnosidase A [Aspergillus steynii IBT 23096]PLB52111.1 alpha-L-rhamnosidase A [Aspergillus steynii IBT 23096]
MALSISRLSFEHHREAIGIAEASPRISWRFHGTEINWTQGSYELEVSRGSAPPQVYAVNSSESVLVPWPDKPLHSAEQARVRVRSHGQQGQSSTAWSSVVEVETGLLEESDWGAAVPIAAERETEVDGPKRPIYFRRSFTIDQDVVAAGLYITALGLYEAEINGVCVGDQVLAPSWQSYNFRHAYDTHDVTDLVKRGANGIGVVVGEGWFSGILTAAGNYRNNYGDKLGHQALLVVTLLNGSKVEIPTDTEWQANTGPLARMKGWSTGRFNSSNWLPVKELGPLQGTLIPLDGPPVKRTGEIQPQPIFQSPSNKTLIDFGQNLVGWVRLTVAGPADTNITLRHVEVLDNGELALHPLRRASTTDWLVLHGNGTQTWEPRFTYHGFRYLQVDGWPASTPLNGDSIQAIVVHTDMERTGWFRCSNELLNKLHDNVVWSMRGNFVSFPTDCPQRDERLGWTGDAHAFGPTANYLYDAAGFWRGWHRDIWSEMQRENTMFVPFFVPVIPPEIDTTKWNPSKPSAIWGDVAVAGPFNHYQAFGDKGMLREQYQQARAWIDSGIPRDVSSLWRRNNAYLVQMTEYIASMSLALGNQEAAETYTKQHQSLVEAFQTAWISNGTMANQTQTAYALGLQFNLFTKMQQPSAVSTLRNLIADNEYLVGTGFGGTPALGFALAANNATEDFYRMLLQTQVPSWLYQVVQNGTTTWERWDSLLPDGRVNPGEMTSFNHYAFGAVADWMHQVIGGLAPAEPGWKRIAIAPVPGGNITSAEARYLSPYGDVRARWWIDTRGRLRLSVHVPPNSRATVTLPFSKTVREVGSGQHEFQDTK